jgi:hypothetical protein
MNCRTDGAAIVADPVNDQKVDDHNDNDKFEDEVNKTMVAT